MLSMTISIYVIQKKNEYIDWIMIWMKVSDSFILVTERI
jgi:hypothetical protein